MSFKVGDVIEWKRLGLERTAPKRLYKITEKRRMVEPNGGYRGKRKYYYLAILKLITGLGTSIDGQRWTSLKYHAKHAKGIVNTLYSER